MAEKKSPVISFKDFSFQYRAQKKPTLTGINLDIYPGEKVHKKCRCFRHVFPLYVEMFSLQGHFVIF